MVNSNLITFFFIKIRAIQRLDAWETLGITVTPKVSHQKKCFSSEKVHRSSLRNGWRNCHQFHAGINYRFSKHVSKGRGLEKQSVVLGKV